VLLNHWNGLSNSTVGCHLLTAECDSLFYVLQGHKQIGGALFSLDIETGEAELLLDNWNGLRFNSPNDLAVRTPTASCPSSGLFLHSTSSMHVCTAQVAS